MDNPETLATLGTQDTGQRVEKTKGTMKNGQPRDTGNIGYIRHRTKGRVNQRDNLLMYPMLPVSLGCPFSIVSLVFFNLCPVTCVPNDASISGLSILDCPFGLLYPLSCVLCTQCWQCLWIVHSWLSLWFSLPFVLCLVYLMLPVSLGCPFLIVSLVFSTLCPVTCVPNVASVSGLSILDCSFGFL
jgi:hypothetical protein